MTGTNVLEEIWRFRDDPLGFTLFAFPWGEKGGPLENHPGPDLWQSRVLESLREGCLHPNLPCRIAVSSGHGIGKGALSAWVILWFMSTRENPQIVVTANTSNQLSSKTWRELAKWHKMAINADWFVHTATRFYHKSRPDLWFASAIPWSEERSEAFAGTHEENVLLLFDEASSISDKIWEVAEGAMTTPGAFWLVMGNPTRNTGRFRECFREFKHRWKTFQIDSRTARMTNKEILQQWIEDWGIDSDFVKVRVLGEFPSQSTAQLIPENAVQEAMNRSPGVSEYRDSPILLGVDPAYFGDDESVLCVRQGLKIHSLRRYRSIDTQQLAMEAARTAGEWSVDVIFVDATGIGAGVHDRLQEIGFQSIPVMAAERRGVNHPYYNLRSQMWNRMKEWILLGGSLPKDPDLLRELTTPEYFYSNSGLLQLEKKIDIKSRLNRSPDAADALALTFAYPVTLIHRHTGFLTPSADRRASANAITGY